MFEFQWYIYKDKLNKTVQSSKHNDILRSTSKITKMEEKLQ